ncbi:MAG: NAD(+) synthase [Ruminiclostridium sp.]|nr:NAD(+) synthase [Ruminiclostridium sp.]
MKDGFVKVGAVVPEVRPGDCAFNAGKITECITKAASEGVRLIVLPELCVAGCTCGDLFLQGSLLNSAQQAIKKIVAETARFDIVCAVGAPLRLNGRVHNCGVVFTGGEIIGIVPKRGLKADEQRYFSAGERSCRFVCRDIPDLDFEVTVGSDRPVSGADIVLQMTAEPEIVGHERYIRAAASVLSYENRCILVSAGAGAGESTAGAVYPGRVMIYENGRELFAGSGLTGCESCTADADVGYIAYERRRRGAVPAADCNIMEFTLRPAATDLTRKFSQTPFVPHDAEELAERCETVLLIQQNALKKRAEHTAARNFVVGISGGLDSTLALIVSHRVAAAVPDIGVIAVTMPCFGTTERTKGNAEKLAELLGSSLRTVDITGAVNQHFRDIGHDPELHNAAFENAQARERTQVLMDIANDTNGLVVGTGDMSELALGWATYGGDQMSMYGVNAGVPKTLMQRIVEHCAGTCGEPELAAVLRDIVATPISPELLPRQKTEDSVGPYELHDFFLYHMIRRGSSPAKIYRIAQEAFAGKYDSETILNWLKTFCRRFFSQQFKRSCSPDSARIGTVSLSPADFRLPSDICGRLWLEEAEGLK